jgi:PEP-CTERM motif
VSSPGLVTQAFLDWTTDGTWYDATRPIFNVPVIPNPLGTDPANVFGPTTQPPWPATTNFNLFAYISPYDDISVGGLDPHAVDGFVMGGLLVSSVPEPSSVVLAGTGVVVMIGVALRARRKVPAESCRGRVSADADSIEEVQGIPTALTDAATPWPS